MVKVHLVGEQEVGAASGLLRTLLPGWQCHEKDMGPLVDTMVAKQ